MIKVLVTGAGGFIGNHLVTRLKKEGFWVRGADLKFPEFSDSDADDFKLLDLRHSENCMIACDGIDWVFNLAADMGGIGYITKYLAYIFRNNALINLHMIEAARRNRVKKYLFSSSACIYPKYLQKSEDVTPLKESDAFPADAEDGYGWEKLFTELICTYYQIDYKFNKHIARFHNIFGPLGAYQGGQEKAPAALCRKVALATEGDTIEIWGDGLQTRSFCYVDDCVDGLLTLINSDYHEPLNIGQDRLISINDLFDMTCEIAGKKLNKIHNLSKPQGVRGRNSDNSLTKQILKWEPKVSLEDGMKLTYDWINAEVHK